MRSLINAINNLAHAINNLASSRSSVNVYPKTITSNPKSNVNITSFKSSYGTDAVTITKLEYDALTAIYNALTDRGTHPEHHDHLMRELKTKWPVLHNALNNLINSRSYYSSYAKYENKSIWKYK